MNYSSLDAYRQSKAVAVEQEKKKMQEVGILAIQKKAEEKKPVIPEATKEPEEKPVVPETPKEPDSQTKAEEAKKKLEEYLQSEERKQNAKERAEKLRKDQFARQLLFGAEAPMVAMEPDRQEEALRAEADYWQQQMEKEKEDAVLQQDLDEIEGLSDAEKAALDTYLIERDRNYYNLINPMTGNAFAGKYSSNVEALLSRLGQKRVDELAFSLSRKRNAETAEKVDAAAREQVDKGIWSGIGANAASVGAKLLGGYTGILETAKDLTLNHKIDPNNMGQMANIYAGAVQGQTAENIEQTAGKPASYLYQGGMALADIGARALAGGGSSAVGATLAATQSFSDTLRDATQKGASTGQALTLATVKSGIEAATEKLPLDELFKVAKGGAKPAAEVVKNILKQAGVEIFEEEASLIGTTLAEAAILQEKSSYNQQVMEAIANGATPEQARQQAKWAIIEEAIDTAIVSGISGGASGIGAEIIAARYGDGNTETQAQEGEQQPQTVQQEPTAEVPNTEQGAQKQEPENWMENGFREAMGKPKEQNLQEDSTTVNTDPSQHTPQEQAVIDDYQNTVDDNLVEYVEAVKNNPGQKMPRYPLKDVSDRAASDIQRLTGIDVSGNKIQIEARTVEHILKRHGENGNADHSMRDVNDIGRIQYVIDNYDSMENGGTTGAYRYQDESGKQVHSQTVLIKKKVNGTYFVVEAVPDTKKKTLYVLSAYMNKNGQKETAPSLVGDAEAYRVTSETKAKSGTVPANSIPQNGMEVNGNLGSTQQTDTFGQSTEGGQVKGTGAAEADFSGKPAYNATLSADNAQADRTADVRPMELPRQDINGGNVSAVTGNVYGSQNTPDDLASAMEEPVARGDFSYIRISNDEATQRAQKGIEGTGSWEEARLNFHDDVRDGKAGAELSARGALILNHAGEVYQQAKATGDTADIKKAQTEWLSILSDVRQLGTNTAQGLQAMKIIRNLMPDDKLEFAKAAVRNMVRDLKIKTEIQIDEKLLTEYENAATDQQRDEIMEKIQQNVANQIPSTMLDKWNALRYTNMLGNLKTTVRNTMGNALNSAAYRAKDIAAASIEAIANKISGGKTGRTKSLIVNKPLQKACGQYFQQVKTAVSSGGKYSENGAASDNFTQGVMDKRNIFKSDSKNKVVRTAGNIAMAPLEGYRMTTNWLMNNKYFGDEAFGKSAFTHAMAGYLQANGVRTAADLQNADAGLLDKAMAYAVKEAQEATFHDNSALANVLGKLKKDTGIIGEGMMPFTKTPANVLTRAEEFSLLGIVNTAVKGIQKGLGETRLADKDGRIGDFARKGQDITGNDIINSLSKSLTGTGIFALGAAMMSQGMLSAGADEDDDKAAFDNAMGKQEYAIVMPDGTSYTFDWATPVALPLFMGAQFMELWQEKDFTFADLEKVFTSIADPMIQMSMMQGINDSLDNIKYSDNNLIQFVANAAVGYLTQGLTNTLAGQIEKSTEKNRQTTYIDKDSDTPEWIQRQLGKAFQKVPGLDYHQTDYVNSFGEKEEQRTDALGWIYNLFSPGYIKKEKQDDVTKELYRLDETGVEGNVFPDTPSSTLTWTDKTGTVHKDEHLTQEQYQTLAHTQGETAKRILDDLVKSGAYQAMTDQQKADIIDRVYEYAAHVGKTAALEGYDGGESWMKDLSQEQETDAIIKKSIEGSFGGAFDDLTDDWNRGNDPAGSIAALDKAYTAYEALPYKERLAFLEENSGRVKYYITSRNLGMDTETFTGLYQTFRDIEGKDKDTAQKAQEWSYTLEKAVDKGIITERQKTNLRENMQFRYSFAAETAKFDAMIEAGVSTNLADVVINTLADLKGSGANGNVQEIDKRRAIAGLAADDATIDLIMHEYMPDYDPTAASVQTTEIKYDYIRQELGMSAQDYVDAYAINLKGGKWKDQKKAIARKLGCSEDAAYELVLIFEGRKKDQLISWYEMQ